MEMKIEPTCQHVTWILNDFLELPQKDDFYLDSPEFFFIGDTYSLRLYPEVNRSNIRQIEFHVRRMSVNFPEREVSCKIGMMLRDSFGDDWYCYTSRAVEKIYTFSRSYIQERRDSYIPDGSFIILCCMRLTKDSRAGNSTQEKEDQEGFAGHNSSFSSRWSPQKMEMSTQSPCTHVQLTVPKFFDLPRETCDSLTNPEFQFAGDTYCVRFRANGDTGDTDIQLVRLTFSFPERTVSYGVGYCWQGFQRYSKNARSLVSSTGLCITRSKLEAMRIVYEQGDTLGLEIFLRLEKENAWKQSSAGAGTSDAIHKRTGSSGFRKLQADYSQLLRKGTESDACVVVRGKEFQVHRVVLRARSPVFEAMFGHDTAEKKSGRVVIDDLDPDSFNDFLEYLYTGDVQERLSDDNAFGLYAAAEKYDVSTLKSECVGYMHRTLSVDSFCDVVTLALLHDEKDLLQQSIRFFKDNMQGIVITAKWQKFMCDNPTSANELLIKAIVPGKQ